MGRPALTTGTPAPSAAFTATPRCSRSGSSFSNTSGPLGSLKVAPPTFSAQPKLVFSASQRTPYGEKRA